MDLAEICRVMGRRWYVLLPGLLVTAALTVGAFVTVPVTYRSQSTVALLNSQRATAAFDGNPFLSTQASLTGMADMLARNLNSDDSLADLRAQGATGAPAAKIADNAQGPLVWLTVSGSDRDAVLASDKLLTAYAAKRLEQLQQDQSVTSQARIRMVTIVPPQNPVAETKTRLEYLVLAGLAGIVVSMVATFYVEARLRRPAGGGRPQPPGPDEALKADTEAGGTSAGGPPPSDSRGSASARHGRPAPRWSCDTPDGSAPDDGAVDDGADDPIGSVPTRRVTAPDGTADSLTTGSDAHRFV
jgi:hypothetical protein